MLATLGLIVVFLLAIPVPRTVLVIVGLSFMLGWWWPWVLLWVIIALIADVCF
jgi:hypothetical protein